MCVHDHGSKCHFWIIFYHFPLNVISVLVRLQAHYVFPMPGESVAIVLASDGSRAVVDWQHHWFPCASCTDPDRAHSLFHCSYHACRRARREEKEGKARGIIESKKRVFPLCSFVRQKANIQSESMIEEPACLFQYVHYLWQRWELNYHLWFSFSLFGHDEM